MARNGYLNAAAGQLYGQGQLLGIRSSGALERLMNSWIVVESQMA